MGSSDPAGVDPTRDVRRLHVLLEDWFVGIRDDVGPLEQALDEGFIAITADGRQHDRSSYLASLSALKGEDPPRAVALEHVEHRRAIYGMHLVTFDKQLAQGPETDEFTCSLWLRETDRVRTGLQWLFLQETAVAPDGDIAAHDTP